MKYLPIISLALIILSCGRDDKKEAVLQNNDAVSATQLPKDTLAETLDGTTDVSNDYQTMYLVIADTSASYASLHKKMFTLHGTLNEEIDTMRRYYDKKLNKIILPVDDEDSTYAGDYYPRRYASSSLSLEYLEMYSDKTTPKTIALVTGIYESEKSADSACAILLREAPKAFKLKSEIYMGCIH